MYRLTVLPFDADHPTERCNPVPRGSDAKDPDDDCTLSLKSRVSIIDVLLREVQGIAGSCVIATECVHVCSLWTALDHDHCACRYSRSGPADSQRPTKLDHVGKLMTTSRTTSQRASTTRQRWKLATVLVTLSNVHPAQR